MWGVYSCPGPGLSAGVFVVQQGARAETMDSWSYPGTKAEAGVCACVRDCVCAFCACVYMRVCMRGTGLLLFVALCYSFA